jgi:hypothetical protein
MSHTHYSIVHTLPRIILLLLLASALVYAADNDFPEAPPKLQDAEAKGLHRLNMDELKTFFPGTIDIQRHRSGLATKTFKPDGSLEVVGLENLSGTWRFDEKHNAYCDRVYKKKTQDERCYAVFSAGDGIHYFDYDIRDNLQTVKWRRAAKQ